MADAAGAACVGLEVAAPVRDRAGVSRSHEPALSGVQFLEHTADVGLEARGTTPSELFERAARGMIQLLVEHPPVAREARTLTLEANELPMLLRAWLRALLRWHEDGFTAVDPDVASVAQDAQGRWMIHARVSGGRPGAHPLREIKGVTLHGLAAQELPDGWYGRVIFDV